MKTRIQSKQLLSDRKIVKFSKQIQDDEQESWTNATQKDVEKKVDANQAGSEAQKLNQNEVGETQQNADNQLHKHVEAEINSMFSSYFRGQNAPHQVVARARIALKQQVAKIVSVAVHKHVATRTKAHCLPAQDILGIIDQFGDHYINKIVKTLMVQSGRERNKDEINYEKLAKQ